MNIITKEELLQRYPSEALDRTSEDDFRIMAELALDVTEILCYGRASRKEEAARRAMMEIIAYWIEGGGRSSVSRPREPIKEAVGNYSVAYEPQRALNVRGVEVSPSALVILDRAGLRNASV